MSYGPQVTAASSGDGEGSALTSRLSERWSTLRRRVTGLVSLQRSGMSVNLTTSRFPDGNIGLSSEKEMAIDGKSLEEGISVGGDASAITESSGSPLMAEARQGTGVLAGSALAGSAGLVGALKAPGLSTTTAPSPAGESKTDASGAEDKAEKKAVDDTDEDEKDQKKGVPDATSFSSASKMGATDEVAEAKKKTDGLKTALIKEDAKEAKMVTEEAKEPKEAKRAGSPRPSQKLRVPPPTGLEGPSANEERKDDSVAAADNQSVRGEVADNAVDASGGAAPAARPKQRPAPTRPKAKGKSADTQGSVESAAAPSEAEL